MNGQYDTQLVLLSVLVAIMASYAALTLAGRVTDARGRAARLWLVGGACTMGAGIWAMHFIGMLAFSLPVAMAYDLPITLASLLIAIAISAFALNTVSKPDLAWPRLLAGGMIMGAGICAMHYSGMAAMRMSPPIQYDPLLFAASVLIAVVASMAALHLAYTLRHQSGRPALIRRSLSAVVMGLAIAGMHYTGMAAAEFAPNSICTVRGGLNLDSQALAYAIGLTMMGLLAATLIAALFDQRLSGESARMLQEVLQANRSLQLEAGEREKAEHSLRRSEEQFRAAFEEAPIGMALMELDGRWLRVNPAFCRMLGYSGPDALPPTIQEITHAEDRLVCTTGVERARATGQTAFQLEKRYLHQDGHTIYARVSGSFLPGTGSQYVAQIEDVTESRRQHERIAGLNRVHTLLSGVSSSIVRVRERQKLYRQICQLAVEQGGFRFAWAGSVSKTGEVSAVAFHGVENGYLSLIGLGLPTTPLAAHGPTTLMLRERKAFISNDIATDPVYANWRDAALTRGYRSMAALPLQVRNAVAGCLVLYSEESGFFDAGEMKLLSDLAGNISYALEFITREEEMDYLVYYDTLTGLANRTLFLERLNDHLRAARINGKPVAVAVIDLDHFKAINDAWGQAIGDRLLISTAERIGTFLRNPLQLARIAGDRFALLLPDVDEAAGLSQQLQDTLLAAIAQPLLIYGQELRVSAKIGLALFPQDGEDADGLLKNAESALKNAKRGSDALCFYTRHLSTTVRERMNLENRLRQAIARKEFLLHYQPKFDLRTGQVSGLEALIRWDSPDMGLVPPQQFIPLLEETGLIREVGEWILQEAIRACREAQQTWPSPPRIAVNVSSLQLQRPDFVDFVRTSLAAAGTGLGLDMEVTESLMLNDAEATFAKLQALRALGIRIAIDDFGTGYSSLAYLGQLPADELKIDRSFIVKMGENSANVALVSTIISMGHSLGLKVIAEGVDSAEQLRFLRLLKCDEVQGFLFSKAVPFARLDAVINSMRLIPVLAEPTPVGELVPPRAA